MVSIVTSSFRVGGGFGRHRVLGGGSPAVLQPYASGLNLNTFARWAFQGAFTDLMHGADAFTYLVAGVTTPLPAANMDANGWPVSVPGDSSNGLVYTVVNWPITACTCDMTWTGTMDTLSSGGTNVSLTQTGPNSATVTFAQGLDWQSANKINAQIAYTPNAANPPKNIQIIPQGRSGIITPEFKASIQSFTGTGPIRFIKWQPAVERTATPLTVTARNTSATALWITNDGVPFEVILQLCVDVNRDGWFNFGLGESDSVINEKFALIDAWLAANPSRTAYIQSSNEDWNGMYWPNVLLLRSWASIDGLDAPVAGAAISSITFSGTTATVTTSTAHGRATNDFIKLTGASPAAYNVAGAAITVTSSTTFTYTMASNPGSNATVVGSYTYGSDAFGGQMKESAKRSNHVMDLLAAAIDPTRMSRVVRVLGTWNAGPSTTDTLLAYTGTPAHHDKLAVGAYWANTTAYPTDGTTRAAPNNVAYTTADFPALLTDLKAGTDAVFDLTAQHQAKAAAAGLGLCAYEWGQQRAFNLLSVATSWYQSQQAYDALMYAAQEWERRFNVLANFFVMTDAIATENNAGRSLQEYQGETISLATTAKTIAFQGYIGNTVRKPNDLTATPLQTSQGDANGTAVGTLTKFVRGSTITVQAISGSVPLGVFAIGDTTSATSCPITIADTSLIPAQGSYSVTLRETDPRFPTPGYHDTVLTWTVAPPLLTDTFSGTTLDSTKWTTNAGFREISTWSTAGVTITVSGGKLIFTTTTSSVPRAADIASVNTYDLTTQPKHFVKVPDSASASRAKTLCFGTPGGTFIEAMRISDGVSLRRTDGTTATQLQTVAGYPLGTYPWTRLRYDAATDKFFMDVAPAAASNPPVESDWIAAASGARSGVSLTGKLGLALHAQFGAVAGEQNTFDGFNTAAG
jgi:hypothetical protein